MISLRKDFSKKLQSFGDDLPLKKFNDKSFENWKESGNRKIRKIFDGIIEEGIIKSRVRRRTDEFSSVSTCLSVTLSRK